MSIWVREKEEQSLSEWLAASHMEVQGQFISHFTQCVGGTLRWLHSMPQIQTWLTNNECPVLWITGFPGVGKSVIAANLIQNLWDRVISDSVSTPELQVSPTSDFDPVCFGAHIYLAFFFCRGAEDKLRYAHNIVQTFSYQLAQQSGIFREQLDRVRHIEQFSVSASVGIRLLFNRLLEQPLSPLLNSERSRDIICYRWAG